MSITDEGIEIEATRSWYENSSLNPPFEFLHGFDIGYKAALQNKVSDPATEQSTANWQKVGEKDKFMDEVRGNESGVSAWKEKAELRLKIREKAKEMFDRYAIYKDNPIAWSVWKIAFNTALNPQFNEKEYASIVNRKDNVGVNEAIEFAEWIVNKEYMRYRENGVHRWFKIGKIESCTTTELFEIFLESQPQKEEVKEDDITDELSVLIREGLDQLEIHKWWDYGDFEDIRDKDDCGYNIAKSISANYSITRK